MERLEGWVPSDNPPMHLAGKIAENLSPTEREAVWWSGLDAMARVHCLGPFELGLGFLDQPARGATPLEQQLHYYDAFLSWGVGDRARYPLVDRALAWLSEQRPQEGLARLCWGDSRLANQVFSGLECIGVPRLQGLPDRAATPARWEQLTGRRAEHLDYYEVLMLTRFSVIMARIGLQMKHYEILPPENDFDVTNLASLTLERKLAEMG